jgi:hypothetical protein
VFEWQVETLLSQRRNPQVPGGLIVFLGDWIERRSKLVEALERTYLCSDAGRGEYDIAAANLMAAAGLRGAEDLDAGYALTWLDNAANRSHIETLRHSYRFRERPEDFENSPAYFCMLVMVTVLRQEFGVRYNPARIRDPKFQDPRCFDPDFSDSRDLFIHGMIAGPGGTCASMPVLYAAVGRRLGYPLRLVLAKGHLFVRWDDPDGNFWSPGASFNIEATSEGLRCPPDEHYLKWPVPVEESEVVMGVYLRPLEPKEEVAIFRSTRAICLWENSRYADALRECHLAVLLAPDSQCYAWQIMDLYTKYRAMMKTKTPAEIPGLALTYEEEVQLQKNIVLAHHERLRRGQPGYNLADFGIYPRALPHDGHRTLADHGQVRGALFSRPAYNELPLLTSQDRYTMMADNCMGERPGPRRPGGVMERANRQNDFNRRNQERLRHGLPGLNPQDYGR